MSFYDVIARLKAAGLDVDPRRRRRDPLGRVRKDVLAYPKCSAEEWIDIMRQAHRHGLRTSATMMYGMGEPLAERVEHFQRIRDLQDAWTRPGASPPSSPGPSSTSTPRWRRCPETTPRST